MEVNPSRSSSRGTERKFTNHEGYLLIMSVSSSESVRTSEKPRCLCKLFIKNKRPQSNFVKRHQSESARPFFNNKVLVPNGRCQRQPQSPLYEVTGRAHLSAPAVLIMGDFDCGRIERKMRPSTATFVAFLI